MSRAFDLECLISDLTRAIDHAQRCELGPHFLSELRHLVATAVANRETVKEIK